MPCVICPKGCATVWMAKAIDGAGAITWVRLVHVDRWNMTPNRQEANKKRTSDTGGLAVKFCEDITDFSFEVTNTLCIDDWLYADILDNPIAPGTGIRTWFFFGWGCEHAPAPVGDNDPPLATNTSQLDPATFALRDSGSYAYGQVSPPGFGVDNNGSDPATADWTLSVELGPLLPFPRTTGAYSPSDSLVGVTDEVNNPA